MTDVQFELKSMAAWVQMADALDHLSWNSDLPYLMDSRSTRVEDSLVGMWVNGMALETMVNWFLLASVPLYVYHAVRGSQDWPDSSAYSIWVKDGLDSCELQRSTVIEVWQSLYKNKDVHELKPDARSSSKANATNFHGESWGSFTEEPVEIEDDSFLPRCPELAPLIPGYEPYINPPPVQVANLSLRIRHYIKDFDNSFERCFKYTLQEDIYSSFLYTYVDRPNHRYLHTDSRLYLEPGVIHPVDVFGLPGPRMKFYNDFECHTRTTSPYWVYKKEVPSPGNVGRIAPVPSVEHLQPSRQPSYTTVNKTEDCTGTVSSAISEPMEEEVSPLEKDQSLDEV
ncbi:hypothetical protein EV360DRAFT_86429 [Lentinula raphanica]|nr:hypothetical protein EV360DRAFT_86429 [Lentinula raphanica]